MPILPETEAIVMQRMKRIEANDPAAMCQEGGAQYEKGNYQSAFECFTKAAELGDAEAHYRLAYLYYEGHGVEKNLGKEVYHLEEAAIGGHPTARHNLGTFEWNNGNHERAVKHLMIAATQGEDESINCLMVAFKHGFVEKEDLASTLCANRAAVDATKSTQRRDAAKAHRSLFRRS